MSVINDYLGNLSPEDKEVLEHVRSVVVAQVPDAVEVISYGMPGYTYKQKYLVTFAAFKDHYSIFPGAEAIYQLKGELGSYKLSKGTIQFTKSAMITDELIRKIVLIRATSIETTT